MGRLHAKAIVDSDLATLAAVVDVDPEARRLADAHGASYHASIEAVLDADDIDGSWSACPIGRMSRPRVRCSTLVTRCCSRSR